MRNILYSLIAGLTLSNSAVAQDIVGFPRADFGRVVLSQKQFGGNLEASIGRYHNEPISKYGRRSLFARLGRPVGRLDILTDVGVFPCTAFLISEKYVLTNHHCVPGIIDDQRIKATRIEAVQLLLGYVRDGIEKGAQRFTVSPNPVELDRDLDYAVLEVFGNPSARYGRITLSNVEPEDSSPFWIIGHPMGEAQRISRENCQSDAPAVAAGRLRHHCDTLPGNSGSPVIDPGLRAAVALHHAGSNRKSINYAVPMASIAQHSKIIGQLTSVTPARASSAPRRQSTRQPTGHATDGLWRGSWCLLKTRRSDKFCIDVALSIKDRTALGQLGVSGQPGYAKLAGTVDQAGKLKLRVNGISKRRTRRGQPYAGSLVGNIVGNRVRASGALDVGRQMTLDLKRTDGGSEQRPQLSAPTMTANNINRDSKSRHPFDGIWRITVREAITCGKSQWTFSVTVRNGTVYGGSRMKPGVIKRDGSVSIEHTGRGDQTKLFRYAGNIDRNGGQIEFQVLDRPCHGIASMQRSDHPSTTPVVNSINRTTTPERPRASNNWSILRTSENCRKKELEFAISIDGQRVSGRLPAGMEISGLLNVDGRIEFEHNNLRPGAPKLLYVGQRTGDQIVGTFVAARGPCKGKFRAALNAQK